MQDDPKDGQKPTTIDPPILVRDGSSKISPDANLETDPDTTAPDQSTISPHSLKPKTNGDDSHATRRVAEESDS